MKKRTDAAYIGVILALSIPGVASAQAVDADQAKPETASEALPDIVVTAEKRETRLQRTPIAVTAIDATTLTQTQTRSVQDLIGRVPNLYVGESAGIAQLAIRGVGSNPVFPGAESAIAINANGVYVSRPTAVLNSFFDLSGVEVLRGPQGTLYGRNATAGSINLTSARPTEDLSGYGRVTVGNYDSVALEGAIGGAIVPDKLLVRVAGLYEYHSGFGKNLVTGHDA